MDLSIDLESLCRIIQRAREYEALTPDMDSDSASDGIDADRDEDGEDNPVEAELRAIIDDLPDDEQAEVIALALIGADEFDAGEWDDALAAASDYVGATAEWVLEQPTFSTDLESGMAGFGLSCTGLGTLA